MADSAVCTGFEPQNYLRDRCKKCFRLRSKHEESVALPASPPAASPPTPRIPPTKKRSFRDPGDSSSQTYSHNDDDSTDLVSVSSYTSATSKGLSSAKSMESVTDTRSMVTAVSGSDVDRDRRATPTENDPSLMISIADELALLREENRQLKEERERWTLRQAVNGNGYKDEQENGEMTDSSLMHMLQERLNEAESCIQDYRDENTVLKCELRQIQEHTFPSSDGNSDIAEKLKTTESLCDELMEENESLKAEVKDLQQEIEEMQDQYREEEIEEFRELQRELEQHAKNSRVLQFKLRKSERAREQAASDNNVLSAKLNETLKGADRSSISSNGVFDENTLTRLRELESELKIAKEVSVRLHGELEQTEEKRYRLEDEVFYLKEKIREMQTQNKWREARNKTETAVKRLSAELSSAVILPTDEMNKDLRDALEREIDTREQLKFAEEDLKRTQLRLRDVENENESLMKKMAKLSRGGRPPMVRSASEGNAHLQLELAEHEVEHLSTKVERLEKTNDHLNKKILELEGDSTKKLPEHSSDVKHKFELTPEMERDMSNLISTIADLERKNRELQMQVRRGDELRKGTQAEPEDPEAPPGTAAAAPSNTSAELKNEQEKRKALELELNEMKQTLLKTDNQKLIAMATKVEVLTNQLALANERCNLLHKKHAKEGDTVKYTEDLKTRVEILEKQLADQRANSNILELQGKVAASDEIEQCCEVLASVEAHTSRICKQIEKLDVSQKEERRRSLSKDSGPAIIAELANVMEELKSVHSLLDHFKSTGGSGGGGSARRSPCRELLAVPASSSCPRCKEADEAAEQARNEILFYKKKNKDLTNQVLQTEDRWTIEIEKQRQIFENEIKTLGVRVADARRQADEQKQLQESTRNALEEKAKALEEQHYRNRKLQEDMNEKNKLIQEQEAEKKGVREIEIKYNKLEAIFEQERVKMNSERASKKAEILALKKAADDAEAQAARDREELTKKEGTWKGEKAAFEREVNSLRRQVHAATGRDGSCDARSRQGSSERGNAPEAAQSRAESERQLALELSKQIASLEKKNAELAASNEKVKIENVDLKTELSKSQAGWARDKDAFQHKSRQTDKIRTVEMDAIQQKFSSRMRIMEDTNKSLHSQLVIARRARDSHKEEVSSLEQKLTEERRKLEGNEKILSETNNRLVALQKQLADMEAELERTKTELRLTKEAKKADHILWSMESGKSRSKDKEKKDKKDSFISLNAEDVKFAESVKKQYEEYEKFYAKEVERLSGRIKEISAEALQKQTENQRTIRELREQIRVLEIEKRNLRQNGDAQNGQKEVLEVEQQRLQQSLHIAELQKLTRKYRLSSIIDQLHYVNDPRRGTVHLENADSLRYIIQQLVALRDEDAHGSFAPSDDRGSQPPSVMDKLGASECDGTYDNISQSSLSIRSSALSIPLQTSMRWTNKSPTGASQTLQATASTSRSFSVDDHRTREEARGSTRKISYPDPPPSFVLNAEEAATALDKDSVPEYDKEGRLHLVPRHLARSSSFDKRAAITLEPEDTSSHARANSAGSNILYKVRREELARGGKPSVRLMAKAFESFDKDGKSKKHSSFFGVRKSQSVDTHHEKASIAGSVSTRSTATTTAPDEISTSTLPRGGRNPFKNMGTRIVERVRRSLSRARSSSERRLSDSLKPPSDPAPTDSDDVSIQSKSVALLEKTTEKSASSPKKTKKKAAESKARKTISVLSRNE